MKFRKKPVVIDASQWFKNGDHPKDNSDRMRPDPMLCEGLIVRYYRHPNHSGDMLCMYCSGKLHDHGWIDTREGGHIVCPGDWIVTGVQGEHYPCKPDIFAATYEPVRQRSGEPTAKPSSQPQKTGFLRFNQIVPTLIPVGKTTWWAGVKSGRFPKPVKLGERMVAWRVEDIDALIEKFSK